MERHIIMRVATFSNTVTVARLVAQIEHDNAYYIIAECPFVPIVNVAYHVTVKQAQQLQQALMRGVCFAGVRLLKDETLEIEPLTTDMWRQMLPKPKLLATTPARQ